MKTVSGKTISSIGIGTFGVGGRGHRNVVLTDKVEDRVYIDALVYALDRGMNFTEISMGYGHGVSAKLLKRALDQSEMQRQDVFITHSLYTIDLAGSGTLQQDITDFYRVMATGYADSTLVTQSALLLFGDAAIYPLLHELLASGKTRYVSLSNASLEWIVKFKAEFGDKFYAHEGHLSFEVRALQDKGMFATCDKLGIKNIIWRPLRRGKTAAYGWPLLIELSQKYQKTQGQIVLNWMVHLGYSPMVFSTSSKHIEENLAATSFTMSGSDYQQVTDFRVGASLPPIDWHGPAIDDDIVRLANEFERFM